jgi:penicillin-binding protein 1C
VSRAGTPRGPSAPRSAQPIRRAATVARAWRVVVLVGLAGLAVAPAVATAVPSFDAVRAAHRPSDLLVLDRQGEPLQSLRLDDTRRVLPWVPVEDLSPALLAALVRGEDRRFWAHAGVDWPALAAAAFRQAFDGRTRGASTITMQLAGLLDEDLRRPAGGRSVGQKADQVLTALQLERRWTKTQILEAYVNRVGWRGEVVGIGALSQVLFGKHPHGLDTLEAALAAALLRGPNAEPAVVARRACALLEPAPPAPCTELQALAQRALTRRGGPVLQPRLAPHAGRAALAAEARSAQLRSLPPARRDAAMAEARLVTTLDARLQRLALQALRTQIAELAGRQVADGAVLVVDNATGEVRAWVGSIGDAGSAPAVDAVLARRQAGSTLKPFVYQAAFAQRRLTEASGLDDAPGQIPTGAGLWRPRNYDHRHRGWVDARTALAESLNLPAVRVAQLVGVDGVHAALQAAGAELDRPPGHYGLSLALGSADVTLLALTNAYRTLANQGRWSPLRLHPLAVDPGPAARPVSDAAAAFVVADILADPAARAGAFGFDSPLAVRGWAAVKTGTSKDLRDNWCLGFTARHTIGVWVGNASGEPMHRVSGVSGAAPVWQALVDALGDGGATPRPPAGLVSAAVPRPGADAAAAPRAGWFLAGTVPVGGSVAPGRPAGGRIGIASPVDGTVVAFDPDIPPRAQRLWLEGEAGTWVIGDRVLGHGERVAWSPVPGRHRLELRDAAGRLIDRVRIEVRPPPPLRPPVAAATEPARAGG